MKNKIAMYMLLALLAAGLVFCGSAAAADLVPAASPRVKTMGRWIPADNGCLYAGRGAVIASVEFEGTGAQVQMFSDSQGDVWWLKKLDDGPMLRFKSKMGINDLYADLPYGKHTLTIIRETEGMRGVTILRGFYFTGEKETAEPAAGTPAAVTADTRKSNAEKGSTGISKAEKKNRKNHKAEKKNAIVSKTVKDEPEAPPAPQVPHRKYIEIIGDSVAAGAFIYPDGDYFQRESGYLAFGPRLARMLNADWSCVASSGEGAVRNNEEKAPYNAKHAADQIERAFYTQIEPRWSSGMDDPDLVILAYGENDFNDAEHRPTDIYFKRQYKNLILKLREFRPDSVIFCVTPANIVTSRQAVPGMSGAVDELRAEGDTKVYFIDLNEQGQLLDGSDFLDGVHPLASGHEKMARFLLEKVRTILEWE
jgi:lysophospholipase L1-like esterase